jgi:hypothetical protein
LTRAAASSDPDQTIQDQEQERSGDYYYETGQIEPRDVLAKHLAAEPTPYHRPNDAEHNGDSEPFGLGRLARSLPGMMN